MGKVFNLGIGMVVVVAADEVYRTLDVLRTDGHRAIEIGEIVTGSRPGPVRAEGVARDRRPRRPRRPPARAQRPHR